MGFGGVGWENTEIFYDQHSRLMPLKMRETYDRARARYGTVETHVYIYETDLSLIL